MWTQISYIFFFINSGFLTGVLLHYTRHDITHCGIVLTNARYSIILIPFGLLMLGSLIWVTQLRLSVSLTMMPVKRILKQYTPSRGKVVDFIQLKVEAETIWWTSWNWDKKVKLGKFQNKNIKVSCVCLFLFLFCFVFFKSRQLWPRG